MIQSSLQHVKLYNSYKIAKNLQIEKLNKKIYTLYEAYWPIFLLPTLSISMEYLIVQKITHFNDIYNLLMGNDIGDLKCKNKLEDLIVFQKKIYEEWKNKKILSFINLAIQKAFNKIARDMLP